MSTREFLLAGAVLALPFPVLAAVPAEWTPGALSIVAWTSSPTITVTGGAPNSPSC
jgi:hypothetical protein